MEQSKHIVIIAGEASGDLHASRLVDSLKKISPKITFSGLGGPLMKERGVLLYEDLTNFAVVGFWEVIKHLQSFHKIFKMILEKIKDIQPDCVVLVDYPGFNLRLARAIKKANVKTKIIYYISPQVWAWKESRVKLIKRVIDEMLVILPFEKEFYARFGMDVKFVGHPLLDSIKLSSQSPENFLMSVGLSPHHYTIGLLPGSREKEIERILPIMLKTAQLLHEENEKIQFVVIQAPTISLNLIEQYVNEFELPLKIIEHSYDAVNATQICMVASGTATLETAILLKPMVVVYKTSFLTWALAKLLVKIPYIGLVNVVAGKKIVAECVQFGAIPKKIAEEIKSIYTNELKIAAIKIELKKIKALLGEPGASLQAARVILNTLCHEKSSSERPNSDFKSSAEHPV